MHTIRLDETLFAKVQSSAQRAGCADIDAYVATLLGQAIDDDADAAEDLPENLAHLFTPERMAIIDRAIAEADAGKVVSWEEFEAHLERTRSVWLNREER